METKRVLQFIFLAALILIATSQLLGGFPGYGPGLRERATTPGLDWDSIHHLDPKGSMPTYPPSTYLTCTDEAGCEVTVHIEEK